MGITVWLEDWKRERIGSVAVDPRNIIHRLLPLVSHDPCLLLNYIDWYGYTVFNHAQMVRVKRELVDVTSLCRDRSERDLIAEIQALVEIGIATPLQYLVFDGD